MRGFSCHVALSGMFGCLLPPVLEFALGRCAAVNFVRVRYLGGCCTRLTAHLPYWKGERARVLRDVWRLCRAISGGLAVCIPFAVPAYMHHFIQYWSDVVCCFVRRAVHIEFDFTMVYAAVDIGKRTAAANTHTSARLVVYGLDAGCCLGTLNERFSNA